MSGLGTTQAQPRLSREFPKICGSIHIMFGIFKKPSESLTLEQKLATLAECGLHLAPPFTAQDLLESWPREHFEKPGFTMTLVGLGMTEERPPWRNHSINVWHFDTECIEDHGSYVRIARPAS